MEAAAVATSHVSAATSMAPAVAMLGECSRAANERAPGEQDYAIKGAAERENPRGFTAEAIRETRAHVFAP